MRDPVSHSLASFKTLHIVYTNSRLLGKGQKGRFVKDQRA
jgi:hypothetical protein